MTDTENFIQYINQKYNLKIKSRHFISNNQFQLTNKQYIYLQINVINLFFPKKTRSITHTKTLAISIQLFYFLLQTQCLFIQKTDFSISSFKKFGYLDNIYQLLNEKNTQLPNNINNFINNSQSKYNNEKLGYLTYLICKHIDFIVPIEKEFLLFLEKDIEKQTLQRSIQEGRKNHLVKI